MNKFNVIIAAIYTIIIVILLSEITEAKVPYNKRILDVIGQVKKINPSCKYTLTSGHRTKEHNKRVRGATNSYHLKNEAIDVVSIPTCEMLLGLYSLLDGLSIITYETHLHIDVRKRQTCLYKFKGKYIRCGE